MNLFNLNLLYSESIATTPQSFNENKDEILVKCKTLLSYHFRYVYCVWDKNIGLLSTTVNVNWFNSRERASVCVCGISCVNRTLNSNIKTKRCVEMFLVFDFLFSIIFINTQYYLFAFYFIHGKQHRINLS